jgi:hypothetical protein
VTTDSAPTTTIAASRREHRLERPAWPPYGLRRTAADFGTTYGANGLVAAIFAMTVPVAVILAEGTRGGLSQAELASWIFGVFFLNGVLTILACWLYRQPLAFFWTIPGTVVVGTSLDHLAWPEVIEHGPTLRGQSLQEPADPTDPFRVQTIDRLIQQQYPRVTEQRRGTAEPLAYAQREGPGPLAGDVRQTDKPEQPRDPRAVESRWPSRARGDAPPRMKCRRLEKRADLSKRPRQILPAVHSGPRRRSSQRARASSPAPLTRIRR